MADVPNEPTPDVPDPTDDLSDVLASAEDVLADLSNVDDLVGDASAVLEGLTVDVPESEELADEKPKATTPPDLSTWSKPRFAVDRIDVSKDAHTSSSTPAERIALVAIPILIVAAFAAAVFLLL